jgi:hypothetical protein
MLYIAAGQPQHTADGESEYNEFVFHAFPLLLGVDGIMINKETGRALWGVDPTGGFVNSAPAGSADGRSAER